MTDHFCPIDHIAIDAVDFDTALAFFKDVFGMTVTRFQGPEEAPTSLWLDGGERGAADREVESLSAFLCDQLDRKRLPKPLLALSRYIAELGDEDGWLNQEDLDGLLDRAARYGAEAVPGKPRHWFRCLGITFEMK